MKATCEGVIYKITNKINGKIYIGKTHQTLKVRIGEHLSSSRNGSTQVIYRAMRKYGEENFVWEVIDEASSPELLAEKEMIYIKKYKSFIHDIDTNGYNMTLGGEGGLGFIHSAETIQLLKNRTMKKGKDHFKSKPVLRFTVYGELIKRYESTNLAGIDILCDRSGITEACSFKRIKYFYDSIWIYEEAYNDELLSERVESVSKLSRFRKIIQLSLEGKIVRKYDNMSKVREYGYVPNSVSKSCKTLNKIYKGYIWMYEDEFSMESFHEKLNLIQKNKNDRKAKNRENRKYFEPSIKNNGTKKAVIKMSLEGEYLGE